MASKAGRNFTEEFKAEPVALLERAGPAVRRVGAERGAARRFGVHPHRRGLAAPGRGLDLFGREVVGWAMADHTRGEPTLAAPRMAVARQPPNGGLIQRSDRGAQHAATACRAAPAAVGARRSTSRKGDPFDNAPMGSFFETPKAELVDDATHAEARRDAFLFLEAWYNRQRSRSAIGYAAPEPMEQAAA